jgi:hypothetical protein
MWILDHGLVGQQNSMTTLCLQVTPDYYLLAVHRPVKSHQSLRQEIKKLPLFRRNE